MEPNERLPGQPHSIDLNDQRELASASDLFALQRRPLGASPGDPTASLWHGYRAPIQALAIDRHTPETSGGCLALGPGVPTPEMRRMQITGCGGHLLRKVCQAVGQAVSVLL